MPDDAALDLVRGGLRFADAETEREYRAWHIARAIPFMRAGLAAAVVAWSAALVVGVIVFPIGAIAPGVESIVGLALPTQIAALVVTRRAPRAAAAAMTASIAVAGAVGVALAFRYDLPDMATVAVVTFAFYAFTIVRLHVLQAVIAAAPCIVLNEILLIALHGDRARVAVYSLSCATATLTGLFACAALDRTSRDSYRRERIIAAQRDTIERERARADVAERARLLSEALLRLSGAPGRAVTLEPGAVVEGRYTIVRALGRGGMGVVHEVERTDGARFALKVLTGEIHRVALARFAREAEIAARLDHPNLVPVLDVGVSESGMLFLVMELVRGTSLGGLRDRFGDAAWALPLLAQIASALAAVHARGIVHRDLKPANVLYDGAIARVADFGLASLADAADSIDRTASIEAPSGLTHTGAILGTPRYMAPELTHGVRDAQPAADVWSFGVMAFEMLTGALPFAEPPVLARLAGRATPAPPALDGAAISAAARDLIEACLRVDPAERPTSAVVSGRLYEMLAVG